DPGLERGRFRVQHVWDTESQKTMVKPRKRAQPAEASPATVAEDHEDEATIVRPRKPAEPAFSVLVRRNVPGGDNAPPAIRPFYKDEISIGRGSRQVTVDLRLEGDLEVSRRHATLTRRGDGQFAITCLGANPVALDDNREIPAGESADVKPGDKITI